MPQCVVSLSDLPPVCYIEPSDAVSSGGPQRSVSLFYSFLLYGRTCVRADEGEVNNGKPTLQPVRHQGGSHVPTVFSSMTALFGGTTHPSRVSSSLIMSCVDDHL